jgi:acylphosphatase
VQGVGFRWYVMTEAEARGLRGYVRNLRDGRVEVVAQGDEPTLTELESALRRGPPHARVTAVEVEDLTLPMHLPAGFQVRQVDR